MEDFIKELGLTGKQIRNILIGSRKFKPKILKRYITDKEVKFAVIGDTQICSRNEKLDELHTFYAICQKVGIKDVFHAGDLVEGSGKIYRGQLNDIHTYGAARQIDYVIENYPKVKGINTFFITGN